MSFCRLQQEQLLPPLVHVPKQEVEVTPLLMLLLRTTGQQRKAETTSFPLLPRQGVGLPTTTSSYSSSSISS